MDLHELRACFARWPRFSSSVYHYNTDVIFFVLSENTAVAVVSPDAQINLLSSVR